jgi:hypothetical protein
VYVRSASIDPQDARYPCVEGILDGSLIQSHVHDFFLCINIKNRRTLFRVFFKRHQNLPLNHFLNIQGDLLVMRVASRNHESIVNLRPSDAHALDRILMMYVHPFVCYQIIQILTDITTGLYPRFAAFKAKQGHLYPWR